MTKVINLFGGSGIGKSTTACGLFYEMKMMGLEVELVREYVKEWAWQGKKVDQYDQVYIFGKQCRREATLYGKVDYIVTDSPLLLSALYEEYYNKESVVKPSVMGFLEKIKGQGIQHLNYTLKRNKPFNPKGRYETEEQAKLVDVFVDTKLNEWAIPTLAVEGDEREKVHKILASLNLGKADLMNATRGAMV